MRPFFLEPRQAFGSCLSKREIIQIQEHIVGRAINSSGKLSISLNLKFWSIHRGTILLVQNASERLCASISGPRT